MDARELAGRIQLGEDSQTEFKEKAIHSDELAARLVWFANARGGDLIFGVSDRGEAVGLEKADELIRIASRQEVLEMFQSAGSLHADETVIPQTGILLRCLEIFEAAKELSDGSSDFIFPGDKPGRPLSNMVFHALLRRMEKTGMTPHGFRSSFRDWAEEKTSPLAADYSNRTRARR